MVYPFVVLPQILLIKVTKTLQNKAVKVIRGGKHTDHATPFHSILKILKVPELYKHEAATLVYHNYRQRLPPLLSNHLYYKFLKSQHDY